LTSTEIYEYQPNGKGIWKWGPPLPLELQLSGIQSHCVVRYFVNSLFSNFIMIVIFQTDLTEPMFFWVVDLPQPLKCKKNQTQKIYHPICQLETTTKTPIPRYSNKSNNWSKVTLKVKDYI